MKKIFIANWKMNYSFDEASLWLANFADFIKQNQNIADSTEIVVCPPLFLIDYLDSEILADLLDGFEKKIADGGKKIDDFSHSEISEMIDSDRPFFLGAQDCHFENSGSFTGDVSAEMLRKIGAEYVIVGHSERRAGHYETDAIVAKKAKSASENGVVPIICIGESEKERNLQSHLEFIYNQLLSSIPNDVTFDKLIIAYEPIWSIGTGIVPSAKQIEEVAQLISEFLAEKGKDLIRNFSILYGGSVTEENAEEILKIKNINGLLVGKASLDVQKFSKICSS